MMRTPPERPAAALVFPQSRCSLWDPSPTGDTLSVHLSYYRNPRLVLSEKTLRLAHRHARQNNKTRFDCFLLGSVTVDLDEEGVAVTLDRFDPGRETSGGKGSSGEPGGSGGKGSSGEQSAVKVPSALAPGDVCVPCVFVTDTHTQPHTDSILQSEAHFHDAFKVLHQALSSRQTGADLSQVMSLRSEVSCSQQGDRLSFSLRWTSVLPGTTLELVSVRGVPVIPTALVRNLTSMGRTTAASQGFLTMDQNRKLLLMLEMDPKACSLPLVGVWLSGVTHIWSPRVWLFCLRFLFSAALQDRVLSEDGCFLVVLFSQLQRQPQFYQCHPASGSTRSSASGSSESCGSTGSSTGSTGSSGSSGSSGAQQKMEYQLLSSTQTFSLYQHVQVTDSSSLQCELTPDLHNQQTKLFDLTVTSQQQLHTSAPPPGLSISDQDSGVEDGDLSPRPSPKPHPSSQQTPRVEPVVPELSLLLDGSFVGPSHPPTETPPPSSSTLRRSTSPLGHTTTKYGLPPPTGSSPSGHGQLLFPQHGPAPTPAPANHLHSSTPHLRQTPPQHPHLTQTPPHLSHPTQTPSHQPHLTQTQSRLSHPALTPPHHPHPTQTPSHQPHLTQTQSHLSHPALTPPHHPHPTQTPPQHPHPAQTPSYQPHPPHLSHPAQTPSHHHPPDPHRAPPPPAFRNMSALPKHLHSTPASVHQGRCPPVQTHCDVTPIYPEMTPHCPYSVTSDPLTPHCPCSVTSDPLTPDPYRLLVEQDRQLKILQAQIQMLLQAQSKATNQTPHSAQQTANSSSGPSDQPMGGTDTTRASQQPIRSSVSVAVGTGASLFWGHPVHAPSANQQREAGSKASSSPASSNSHPEESDSRLHQSGFCSPSPRPRCGSVSSTQSPVLGESASMYQHPSPPPPTSTHSFYTTLLNQVNSLLHSSHGEEEEEEEDDVSIHRRRGDSETSATYRRSREEETSATYRRSREEETSAPYRRSREEETSATYRRSREELRGGDTETSATYRRSREELCGANSETSATYRRSREELRGGDSGITSATYRQLEQLGVPAELMLHDSTSVPLASISPAALLSRLSPPEPCSSSSVFVPPLGGAVDMTMEWNAIALRRVPDAQLNKLLPLRGRSHGAPGPALSSTPSSSTPDVSSPSNMSLATRKYMRRYGVLEAGLQEEEVESEEGGANPFTRSEVNPPARRPFLATPTRGRSPQTDASMGNFLDISRLRQLPKLF